MAARREDEIEMEDETCDQTGQNSAGQVSYYEHKVHAFCDSKRKREIISIPPDTKLSGQITKWMHCKLTLKL